jgi:regulator of cell morphogenesis and NO signaling
MARPDIHSTLREWLAFRPAIARVFTKHGIDLCRDAEMSLANLCRYKNIDPLMLKAEVDRFASATHHELGADWATAPLLELCDHLEKVHHAFLRRELPRLTALLEKVTTTYATSHPDTHDLDLAFQAFRTALESHLEREERELFPAVRELMKGQAPAKTRNLDALINSLEEDHDVVDGEFLHIRQLTHGFVAPPDVCQTFQSLLDGLWDLEMNLHQNVYEENRFLFPRALRHEAVLRATEHAKSPA